MLSSVFLCLHSVSGNAAMLVYTLLLSTASRMHKSSFHHFMSLYTIIQIRIAFSCSVNGLLPFFLLCRLSVHACHLSIISSIPLSPLTDLLCPVSTKFPSLPCFTFYSTLNPLSSDHHFGSFRTWLFSSQSQMD